MTCLLLVLAWSLFCSNNARGQAPVPGDRPQGALQNMQQGTGAPHQRPFCASDELLDRALQQEPALEQRMRGHDEQIKVYTDRIRKRANSASPAEMSVLAASSSGEAFIIPVVVYVVHQNGPEDITDQQVISQLDALNDAFDPYGIKFCLATADGGAAFPGPTPGLFRIQDPLTDHHIGTEEAQLKGLSTLPPDRYLRIWVVKDIDNGSGVAGYARFPGVVPPSLDGIVMRHDFFGDSATCGCSVLHPNYDQGKILAHEVGHYLYLYHTFQGGCSGLSSADCQTAGDRVCDTPPVAVANTGCPTSPADSCLETPDSFDLLNNEMDYTDDTCRSAFTPGQADRMISTLNLYRPVLFSPENLVHTQVQCAGGLNAAFAANDSNACTNTAVTFTAINNAGAVYSWDFGDGDTGAGNPVTHTYLSPGTRTVTLTVSSGADSVSSSTQVFVTACPPIHSSQGHWYFGFQAGLDFSSGVPVADLSGKLGGPWLDGTLTQSDANGQLLFYSDGVDVYNQNHVLMNPGNPLNGNVSNAQGALSVPDPGNPNRYYLFTLGPGDAGGSRLWYTIVDLTTPPGVLTDINTLISFDLFPEGITAVPHCNGRDFWVVLPPGWSGPGRSYLLTASGISGRVDSSLTLPATPIGGALKASPDGTMLALAMTGQLGPCICYTTSAVLDFNKATGVMTLRNILDHGNYGASFSPDSKLLYVADDGGLVYQYDLTVPDPNATVAVVDPVPGREVTLQLGPDQKIYLTIVGRSSLAVINFPNQRNTSLRPNAAGFNADGPSLGGRTSAFGLPNMIDARPTGSVPPDFTSIVSSCTTVSFNATPCASSYSWDFGDSTMSTLEDPVHTYSAQGTYTVRLTVDGSTTVAKTETLGLTANIAGPDKVCTPGSGNLPFVNYSSTNAEPGLVYNWAVTGGTVSSVNNADNIDVVWSASPGAVTLTINDPVTGCTDTASLNVTNAVCGARAGDHYTCYETKARDFRGTPVTLTDQFGTITGKAVTLADLCAPVDKNGEGINNPDAHLTCYELRDTGPHTRRTVTVDNQFGAQVLTVKGPNELCLPAIKSVSGPASGDPRALDVNHFLCYKAEPAPPGRFAPQPVALVDQFASWSSTAKRPVTFCTPVDKNNESTIVDATGFLVCYELDRRPPVTRNVSTLDQFGSASVKVQKPETVCVPSTLVP